MTEEERLDARFQLSYRAEYSSRYHRRRASFITQVDSFINLVTLISGASAFGALAGNAPILIAKLLTAVVAVLAIVQILFKFNDAASHHAGWLKRWTDLGAELRLNTDPTDKQVERWEMLKAELETECLSEFRALVVDCENIASRVMALPGRQRRISPVQRFFMHLGTGQADFPSVPD